MSEAAMTGSRWGHAGPADYATMGDGQELRAYFREHEAAIGFRSTFGPMLAALEGVALGSGHGGDHDPHAARLDREWDEARRKGLRLPPSRWTRVWRALRVLDAQRDVRTLVVLHRLYGDVLVPETTRKWLHLDSNDRPAPTRWRADHEPSEAACLARLTPTAERAREDMAYDRGVERESETRLRCASSTDDAAQDFWRMAPRWEALAREWEDLRAAVKADKAKLDAVGPRMRALSEERAKLRKRLDQAMSSRPIVELSAVHTVLAGADHETTVESAIEARLGDSSGGRRATFIHEIITEARSMKADAHRLYQRAKVLAAGASCV